MALGVGGEHAFVFHQHHPHNGGVVRVAELHVAVGDEVALLVRVGQCEGGLGHDEERHVLVRTLDVVFDHVGEEFELLDEVWELRRVDLCELDLEHRQLAVDALENLRRDLPGSAVNELKYFSHARKIRQRTKEDKPQEFQGKFTEPDARKPWDGKRGSVLV